MSGDSTAVVAHFSGGGRVSPRRFEWQGRLLTVEGIGRRWREGECLRFNVMAMGGRLFELTLNGETFRWSVARGPLPPLAV